MKTHCMKLKNRDCSHMMLLVLPNLGKGKQDLDQELHKPDKLLQLNKVVCKG